VFFRFCDCEKMTIKKDEAAVAVEKKEAKKTEKKTEKKVDEKVKKKEAKKTEKKTEKKADEKVEKKAKKSTSKHWEYFDNVDVSCICGAKFTINTTVPWPIKVETCYQCHPTYNPDKVIKKVVKWRLEKFLEKQKRVDAAKNKK